MKDAFFKLVPHMREYLDSRSVYMPYVMNMNEPGVHGNHFDTDHFGFRYSIKNKAIVSYEQFSRDTVRAKCAFVGNSTAFGVGSTGNHQTIPSKLNDYTESTWFNFSGRMFNSRQELLLYLSFAPRDIENLVLFSGINNLDMGYRWNTDESVMLPPYLVENHVLSRLSQSSKSNQFDLKSTKLGTLVKLFLKLFVEKSKGSEVFDFTSFTRSFEDDFAGKRVLEKYKKDISEIDAMLEDENSIVRSLESLERDLRHWQRITKPAEQSSVEKPFVFVLQPVPEWTGKTLSPEESELFACVEEERGEVWRKIAQALSRDGRRFRHGAKSVCEKLGIPFLDSNEFEFFRSSEWAFVDRYHLTDLGYDEVAKEIAAFLSINT